MMMLPSSLLFYLLLSQTWRLLNFLICFSISHRWDSLSLGLALTGSDPDSSPLFPVSWVLTLWQGRSNCVINGGKKGKSTVNLHSHVLMHSDTVCPYNFIRRGECLQLSPLALSWLCPTSPFTLSMLLQPCKWRMRHFHWLTQAKHTHTNRHTLSHCPFGELGLSTSNVSQLVQFSVALFYSFPFLASVPGVQAHKIHQLTPSLSSAWPY